jgi:hypothetical protein
VLEVIRLEQGNRRWRWWPQAQNSVIIGGDSLEHVDMISDLQKHMWVASDESCFFAVKTLMYLFG